MTKISAVTRCSRGVVFLLAAALSAQTPAITDANWGAVTAPVYGMPERSFGAADLFAGPNKLGSYYDGVLPNGMIVRPVGTSVQVGPSPLGVALTPDGRYLITSNDNERSLGASLQDAANTTGYSLSVLDTAAMKVVSRIAAGRYFIGLQITGDGPYTVWVSGGPDNNMRVFNLSAAGAITAAQPATITIAPIQPRNGGLVSNYAPAPAMNAADRQGNKPPVPVGFNRTAAVTSTFPAGSALSPDGRFLYVACYADNSVAAIDTRTRAVVRQLPAGFFPYGVAVSANGQQVMVSNWGMTEYRFADARYDDQGRLALLNQMPGNQPFGYFVPFTEIDGDNPRTSSVSFYNAPGGDGTRLAPAGAIYQGKPIHDLYQVGDTHPSAMAIVRQGAVEVLYVAKSNSDALGRILLGENRKLEDVDIAPLALTVSDGHTVHGSYPNALAVSPDQRRLYVAEAGLNSVAVLDTSDPLEPKLLGRIPTGWYPAALTVSADGRWLYVGNAKGIGPDLNPKAPASTPEAPTTGMQSVTGTDSNTEYGTVQRVDLASHVLDNTTVLANNFAVHPPADTSVVPAGGRPSSRVKHVFFILKENKTFDSMLGNMKDHFGAFASTVFHDRAGKAVTDAQYTGVSLNLQLLARTFATGVNYYSDAEESDAGHQFATSGTATDHVEKTLNNKGQIPVMVNKHFEPEDYPESGYIFNNAARNGVSLKVFGDMSRLAGVDAGGSTPTTLNDPDSGNLGYPTLKSDKVSVTSPVVNAGDVTTPTKGLGSSYFLTSPGLAVLGGKNPGGEPRVDSDYPGYNFNISDQRRARRFMQEFDRMMAGGTLPQFVYIYLPNDHTGSAQAPNASTVGTTAAQQVADGDVALGMVVNHIMKSPVYYNPATGDGAAIFVTWDDAQATLDHIHPHRTPLVVVSPYAKPGSISTRHYSTASIVKTEELLLGLPPNNLGDLFATDLRDMFQATYNRITADQVTPKLNIAYTPSTEGQRIWALAGKLDLSGPDRDSDRLGKLARLSMQADRLHDDAASRRRLGARAYKSAQKMLYAVAVKLVT
jgi:YVTN family beta-propeller protein